MPEDSKTINFSLYLLLIGMIFVISYFLIRPFVFEIKKDRAELLAYQSLLRQKKETLDEFNKIAISYKEKQASIAKINEIVPHETDMIYTLIQFENISSQAGMVMKNISFGSLESNEKSAFSIFPVNISVEGTYENFKYFLDLIASNIFLMDVASVGFSESQTPGIYTFNLRVDTYIEKAVAAPANEGASQIQEGNTTSPTPASSPNGIK